MYFSEAHWYLTDLGYAATTANLAIAKALQMGLDLTQPNLLALARVIAG